MRRAAGFGLVVAALASTVTAFSLNNNSRWPDGSIVMQMQLGSSGTLIDGSSSWSVPVEDAMANWNNQVSRVQLRVVRNSTAARGDNDDINSVFFSSTAHGDPFDDDTLAVATQWRRGSTRTETDVIFNSGKSWNSYRGALRRGTGETLHDIRRVALHEFGHVLNLYHPDEYGQSVAAIMNSRTSNIESLQTDDINGVRAAYGGGTTVAPPPSSPPVTTVVVTFPARNETLDFRQQLESKYRNGMGRLPGATFVDVEGTAVWLQEYLRYRVSRCDHATAQTRAFAQIDGSGIQPVCAVPTSLAFPLRSDSLAFRQALEVKYRDGLRRSASSSSVDVEGEAVWMQEYLRYRVNRCGHPDAVNRVFQQIDGRGIAATC